MSDTPRTDGEETFTTYPSSTSNSATKWVRKDFARQLERELAAANARVDALSNSLNMLADRAGTTQQSFNYLLQAAQEIYAIAHMTDMPDIADDGGKDHLGEYKPGAWSRFRAAIDAKERGRMRNGHTGRIPGTRW